MREADPMLRRFERNQVIACAAMAVVSLVVGRVDIAFGVLGGGFLMAIGYSAIKGAVTMLVTAAGGTNRAGDRRKQARRRAWTVLKFVARYALLALAAYVMLVRLHMHPVGLLLGASCPVAAAVIELVRMARVPPRTGDSR